MKNNIPSDRNVFLGGLVTTSKETPAEQIRKKAAEIRKRREEKALKQGLTSQTPKREVKYPKPPCARSTPRSKLTSESKQSSTTPTPSNVTFSKSQAASRQAPKRQREEPTKDNNKETADVKAKRRRTLSTLESEHIPNEASPSDRPVLSAQIEQLGEDLSQSSEECENEWHASEESSSITKSTPQESLLGTQKETPWELLIREEGNASEFLQDQTYTVTLGVLSTVAKHLYEPYYAVADYLYTNILHGMAPPLSDNWTKGRIYQNLMEVSLEAYQAIKKNNPTLNIPGKNPHCSVLANVLVHLCGNEPGTALYLENFINHLPIDVLKAFKQTLEHREFVQNKSLEDVRGTIVLLAKCQLKRLRQ